LAASLAPDDSFDLSADVAGCATATFGAAGVSEEDSAFAGAASAAGLAAAFSSVLAAAGETGAAVALAAGAVELASV